MNDCHDESRLGPTHGLSEAGATRHLADTIDQSFSVDDPVDEQHALPKSIGKYAVKRQVGQGSFGIVYLAWHPHLEKDVAVKLARQDRFRSDADLENFLNEARHAMRLRHPGIVAVYDVDLDNHGLYIVQDYIDGCDLFTALGRDRFSPARSARLVAEIAEAISHAHQQGLFHCDLKPQNILLDAAGRAFVADFGLALHESRQQGRKGVRAGTPRYMAPEQVRGEMHRLDGRADIWSLGVILYEMLVGRPPFSGRNREELYEAILAAVIVPPRQIEPDLSAQLERICLRCLAPHVADRYPSATDLAEELRHWLNCQAVGDAVRSEPPVKILPKGLRAFDGDDADFFIELLPGPKDRDGLPDSIRFWKARIEPVDPDRTFPVGLIYGPSGSGKSSFVKAGLLPRLNPAVLRVYVEATARDMAVRLANEIRKKLPAAGAADLPDLIAGIREGEWLPRGQKLLLVLDQFEQYLHAAGPDDDSPLVAALRHCDGGRVQSLITIRDDFWMAATRFLHALDVKLVQGHNVAAVDRFDERHAAKVLTLFGQAYGALPDDAARLTADQQRFVEQSVQALAEDDRVICVRLALFADMVKAKRWVPETLAKAGGTAGVGVAFLEETFGSRGANPAHRCHARAAQDLLRELMPEVGLDIKGHMKSYDELLHASPYADDENEFADLVHVLDSELRLITPAQAPLAPPGVHQAAQSQPPPHYQLTHDFLVPALREWLWRKQKETHRGRAEIRLTERSMLWNGLPETKQLPTLLEWAAIRLLIEKRRWSEPQRRMMRAAKRRHLLRAGSLAGILFALAIVGIGLWHAAHRSARLQRVALLVEGLRTSEYAAVPELIDAMELHRPLWQAHVAALARDPHRSIDERTRAHLALARFDDNSLEFLTERLLEADAATHRVLKAELRRWDQRVAARLWAELRSRPLPRDKTLRAAAVLAHYDPSSPGWNEVADRVVQAVVSQDPLLVHPWIEDLRPVRNRLRRPLIDAFHQTATGSKERVLAASIIANFAMDHEDFLNGQLLSDLVLEADASQYTILLPITKTRLAELRPKFVAELKRPVPLTAQDGNQHLLERQASAAETLLRMGASRLFWPRLRWHGDPRLRTTLIDRIRKSGLSWRQVRERLEEEDDPGVRQALLVALEGYRPDLAQDERGEVVAWTKELFEDDPDAAVHAAAEWLLVRWGDADAVRTVRTSLAGPFRPKGRNWFINTQGMTMLVVPGPVTFTMGSPEHETGRDVNEVQHEETIGVTYAISAHEVSVEQFARFNPSRLPAAEANSDRTCPINRVSWYEAVRYCRWLSEQEGLAEDSCCYPPLADIGPSMSLPDDWYTRPGYRLPTAAEWEYAARAATITSRFYGDAPELLDQFAWNSANSDEHTWPVGLRKPNPFGLFDVYGNVGEWCHGAGPGWEAQLRGGSYRSTPRFLRSAMPTWQAADGEYSISGLRVAMTIDLE
ncbi:MAG: protein kinase [Pirellulales bacterium]